jgi:hypothetical protein
LRLSLAPRHAAPVFFAIFLTFGFQAPALASRVIDLTDEKTKEYCIANPEKCETRWAWEYTIGLIAFLLIARFGWNYAYGFLSKHRTPGLVEKGDVKPTGRVEAPKSFHAHKPAASWTRSDAIAFYLAIDSRLPKISPGKLFDRMEQARLAGLSSRDPLTSEQKKSLSKVLDEGLLDDIKSLPISSIITLAIFNARRKFISVGGEFSVMMGLVKRLHSVVIAASLQDVEEFDVSLFSSLVKLTPDPVTKAEEAEIREGIKACLSDGTWVNTIYVPMLAMAKGPFVLKPGIQVDPLQWAEWYQEHLFNVIAHSLGDSSRRAWAIEALAPFANRL